MNTKYFRAQNFTRIKNIFYSDKLDQQLNLYQNQIE